MSRQDKIIIRGVTSAGRKFRPSDWSERLCSLFATTGAGNRTCYSPHVLPTTRAGVNCVIVSRSLEQTDPMAYRFLMDFARDNDLQLGEGGD